MHPDVGEYNKTGIASLLGVNEVSFSLWVNSGRCTLPSATRKKGNRLFWSQDTIFGWIANYGEEGIKKSIRENYAEYRRGEYKVNANNREESEWYRPGGLVVDDIIITVLKAFYLAR